MKPAEMFSGAPAPRCEICTHPLVLPQPGKPNLCAWCIYSFTQLRERVLFGLLTDWPDARHGTQMCGAAVRDIGDFGGGTSWSQLLADIDAGYHRPGPQDGGI